MNKLRKLPSIPMAQLESTSEEPCCGPPLQVASSPHERPGYTVCRFVEDFVDTPSGYVPVVAAKLHFRDLLGSLRARIGIQRDYYKVAPGLYCVGKPEADSPVLVSGNYKLTFDTLRRELSGVGAWILVLDTRGVNVWCAAGKKTFCTDELVYQVKRTQLAKVVSHTQLILPQLGAAGVSAHQVKKACGFEVKWGPIQARDVKNFLENDLQATSEMREVTFPVSERAVLIPVELSMLVKPSWWVLIALFFLSGIGPEIFSIDAAWLRGQMAATYYLMGIVAGAVVVPLILPWLPSRKFYFKGIVTGILAGAGVAWFWNGNVVPRLELIALLLISTVISSYAAMNFTGATPYTSPSGVEKEMRQAIPVQIGMVAIAFFCWLVSPFMR